MLGRLENNVASVGGEIQLTDGLDELLKVKGPNAFETDAGVFDCGNKQVVYVPTFQWGCVIPRPSWLSTVFVIRMVVRI